MVIKIGLIGYGYAGATIHAPIIKSNEKYKIISVMTSKPTIPELPDATTTTKYEELLSNKEINLLVITSPNTTHYELAKSAIKAQKNVVVEKPFTITSQQAQELIDLAQENNVILTVFHNRRWDSDFLTLKNILEQKLLGQISTYESHFDRYRPNVRNRWREDNLPGSGNLYDLGSHLIDQATSLFGLPQTVYADIRQERENARTNDYFHIILGYASHKAILHSSSLTAEPGAKLSVHGTKGSYLCKDFDPQEEQLKAGLTPKSLGWGVPTNSKNATLTVIKDDYPIKKTINLTPGCYETFYEQLASAILNKTQPPIDPKDAMNTMKIIELATKSNLEKRVVEFE